MNESTFYCIGKISKTFGYQGKIIILFDNIEPSVFEEKEWFFVKIKQETVPFFITEYQPYRNFSAIIKFEDIDSETDARKLCGCEVYLPSGEKPEVLSDDLQYRVLEGFTFWDKPTGLKGKIHRISELPEQIIMQVFIREKEVLIPLHEDFIINIDYKKSVIKYQAPDGLIDFYLS